MNVAATDDTGLSVRAAASADLPWLAQMNHDLIRAEGSRNPYGLPELEARLAGWLAADSPWRVIVIAQPPAHADPATPQPDTRVGYCVFRIQLDDYDPQRQEVHVRQLYVAASARGAGIGRQALALIAEHWFPTDAALVVETLATNPRAQHFWQQIGLLPYATTLRRESGV